MKKRLIIFMILSLLLYSCEIDVKQESIESWKAEIVATEKAFAQMAKEKSIAEAFIHFAADDAVIMRGNAVIVGREQIIKHFNPGQSSPDRLSLEWAPDFVEVAASGDLGYTYGKYIYTKTDTLGNTTETVGIFHTVWKRQPDGQWRFVWD